MTTYNKSLKDDSVKFKIIEMSKEGFSGEEIGRELSIPSRSVRHFLSRSSFPEFWEKYSELCEYSEEDTEELVEDLAELNYLDLAMKLKKVITKSEPLPYKPKILFFDIEISPIAGAVWGLWQNNVGLNQIERDWYVLSWSAKWQHEDIIMYQDKSDSWDTEDDSELLKAIWKLLDEADIVVGQNSKRFDEKKLNARFILNGMKPPSSYRSIDTLEMAKRSFGFTSNKLEYMTDKLCKRYKKLKHGKFAGFELWKECLRGNPEAWVEMADYNKNDVLSLEELYGILRPWYKAHPNLNVYNNTPEVICTCGHDVFEHSGYHYTNLSKFDRFKCVSCGAETRGSVNLLSPDKKEFLRRNIL